MGEAKKRGSFDERVKAAEVGLATIEHCYAMLLDVAQNVYKDTGGLNHDLKGITVRDGKGTGVSSLIVTDPQRVPELVQQLLGKWPLVVQTMEVWHTTKPGMLARDDPDRQDAVSFMFYTKQMVMCAICPVDVKARTIEKGELGIVQNMMDNTTPDGSVSRH